MLDLSRYLPHALLLAASAALMGAAFVAPSAGQKPDPALYAQKVRPLLEKYCGGCHGPKTAHAGIDITKYADPLAIQKDQTTWRKIVKQIHDQTMPPAGSPKIPAALRDEASEWLRGTLDSADESLLPKNPGRVLIHRLSREEYNNTLRDLLGITSRPADSFPADGGGGGGFDNNADTLFIPPVLMERLLEAAGSALDEAKPGRIATVAPGKGVSRREAARRSLTRFMTRAFRRPVTPAETTRYLTLFDRATARKESFEASLKYACKAVLVSPGFLFRVERDRKTDAAYLVGQYEMASRLSYFLWSSMPDDTLFALAAKNRLHDPAVLAAQVRRMLRDPKASALAENFASQWLHTRELTTSAKPDPRRFPDYTPSLRDAMIRETTAFFDSVVRSDESLLNLLHADYTFLNEELARHYGIPGVTGAEMRRVKLPDGRRGGLITTAGVLTLTSYPQRTSPVLRGKWVMEEILGAPVPPPPPDAGGLPVNDAPQGDLTFRKRLELHRDKPQCASCHARMDPLGFGLENFDAIGRWREEIGGVKVDSTGILANGEKFTGPEEMKQQLLKQKGEFIRTLSEKLLSYALGRGLEPYDLPAIRRITSAVEKESYRSETLLREIVMSYPFRYRKNG